MPGVFDCAGFTSGSRFSSLMMWPSACPYGVGTPNEMDFAAQYPACLCPCQRFACHLAANTRMTRGQDGSLLLSCRTLSFLTPCRFIPAHMGHIGSHVDITSGWRGHQAKLGVGSVTLRSLLVGWGFRASYGFLNTAALGEILVS